MENIGLYNKNLDDKMESLLDDKMESLLDIHLECDIINAWKVNFP